MNPYQPPGADLGTPGGPSEPGSALKAVIVGLLVDTALTLAISFVFVVLYGAVLAAGGVPGDEIASQMGEPSESSFVTLALLAIGGTCSVLGGLVCARIAKHSELRLGAILAALGVGAGLLMGGLDSESSAALNLMSVIVTVFATMFGAWAGRRINLRGR